LPKDFRLEAQRSSSRGEVEVVVLRPKAQIKTLRRSGGVTCGLASPPAPTSRGGSNRRRSRSEISGSIAAMRRRCPRYRRLHRPHSRPCSGRGFRMWTCPSRRQFISAFVSGVGRGRCQGRRQRAGHGKQLDDFIAAVARRRVRCRPAARHYGDPSPFGEEREHLRCGRWISFDRRACPEPRRQSVRRICRSFDVSPG